MSFELQLNKAIGKLEKDIGKIQGRAFFAFVKEFRKKTPIVTGEVTKKTIVRINGRKVNDVSLLKAKANDKLTMENFHPAITMLDEGKYRNPGKIHWSKYNTGILIRTTNKGFYVIRTTSEGFSTKAPKGMLRFARLAYTRSFRRQGGRGRA